MLGGVTKINQYAFKQLRVNSVNNKIKMQITQTTQVRARYIYTQEFCPKQFNNKRKNTFFMSKSRVTHKSRNGEGDIHFKSITVSLLLRCHLF